MIGIASSSPSCGFLLLAAIQFRGTDKLERFLRHRYISIALNVKGQREDDGGGLVAVSEGIRGEQGRSNRETSLVSRGNFSAGCI